MMKSVGVALVAGVMLAVGACKPASSNVAAAGEPAARSGGEPRAYGIFAAKVNDELSYYRKYLPAAKQTLQPYGAQAVAFGKDHVQLEGPTFDINIMFLEYPNLDVLHTWYQSSAYAPVKDIRMAATTVVMSVAKSGEKSAVDLSAATTPGAVKPKALVFLNDAVSDQAAYDKYDAKAETLLASYGARSVVKGHKNERLEGDVTPDNLTVLEFPDKETLVKWHESPEYQALAKERLQASSIVFMIGHEALPAPK